MHQVCILDCTVFIQQTSAADNDKQHVDLAALTAPNKEWKYWDMCFLVEFQKKVVEAEWLTVTACMRRHALPGGGHDISGGSAGSQLCAGARG